MALRWTQAPLSPSTLTHAGHGLRSDRLSYGGWGSGE